MTNKQKLLIFILLTILILIVVFCIYYFGLAEKIKIPSIKNLLQNESLENENNKENNDLKENEVEENPIQNEIETENTISNTTNTEISKSNTSIATNTTSAKPETKPETKSTELDIDEVKKLLESYSVGIQRIIYGGENLESNTILLFLAKQYFDSSPNKKSSLKVDTTYASTVKNIHKYLEELVGTNYSNMKSINSYKNYVGYSSGTNSYEYGADISVLKDEQYECPKLELTQEKNGVYTAKGEVIRIANGEETAYEITLIFQINQNYTYQKYQIISLKSANKSFYPDNTVHLIDNNPVE